MRRGLVGRVACALAVAAAGSAQAATPPGRSAAVELWGQPERALEVDGRPLAKTLAVFADPTSAARLPAPTGLMQPLGVVARHLLGHPGALVPGETRRVTTAAGSIYLVPTVRGWLCVQGPTFQTCHRGLLAQGATWDFYSSRNDLAVVGIAANGVRAITLVWGGRHRRAELAHNVFFVHRPVSITSMSRLPPLGRLVISYRSGRPPVTIALRG